ncbi:unnamed protein product [Orchesella dallaii]|uniref:Uncharacterized protein n=1 Tax=Orchesella dallaii TaxID=48710 RepID=A0ABP1RWJ4_9HEXA
MVVDVGRSVCRGFRTCRPYDRYLRSLRRVPNILQTYGVSLRSWSRVSCSLQQYAIHRCFWSSKGIYGHGWKAYRSPHEHTGTLAGTRE